MADEQEEAYLRALRRLEKEKEEKKNQQGLMGCLLFIIIAVGFVSCVNSLGNNSSSSSSNGSNDTYPNSYASLSSDPTIAQWRASNDTARGALVRTWTEALSPGLSSDQLAGRARELGDCIREAEPAAPPEWKVRENLTATCAMMMGWR